MTDTPETHENIEQEQPEIEVDWIDIKNIYLQTDHDLRETASAYGIGYMDIVIKAKKDGWGERGSLAEKRTVNQELSKEITIDSVTADHKVEIEKSRTFADDLIEEVMADKDLPIKDKIHALDKVASLQHKLIPIERKVHNIDSGMEDLPARIFIVRDGEKLEQNLPEDDKG